MGKSGLPGCVAGTSPDQKDFKQIHAFTLGDRDRSLLMPFGHRKPDTDRLAEDT